MNSLRTLAEVFLNVLSKAQEQRRIREDWLAYELTEMLLTVNKERLARGLPFVTSEEIAKADRCAAGHVDYSRKFALYCAELALGISPFHKEEVALTEDRG